MCTLVEALLFDVLLRLAIDSAVSGAVFASRAALKPLLALQVAVHVGIAAQGVIRPLASPVLATACNTSAIAAYIGGLHLFASTQAGDWRISMEAAAVLCAPLLALRDCSRPVLWPDAGVTVCCYQ